MHSRETRSPRRNVKRIKILFFFLFSYSFSYLQLINCFYFSLLKAFSFVFRFSRRFRKRLGLSNVDSQSVCLFSITTSALTHQLGMFRSRNLFSEMSSAQLSSALTFSLAPTRNSSRKKAKLSKSILTFCFLFLESFSLSLLWIFLRFRVQLFLLAPAVTVNAFIYLFLFRRSSQFVWLCFLYNKVEPQFRELCWWKTEKKTIKKLDTETLKILLPRELPEKKTETANTVTALDANRPSLNISTLTQTFLLFTQNFAPFLANPEIFLTFSFFKF